MADAQASGWPAVGRLLDAVRSALDTDVAFLVQYGRVATIRATAGDASGLDLSVGSRVALETSASLACTQGRLPAVIGDTQRHRSAERLLCRRPKPIRAFGSMPIHLPNGQLFGALCIADHAPKPGYGDADVRFLRTMADVVAVEVAQIHQRRSQRHNERRELLSLLDGDGLQIVFQPIVSLVDGTTVGVEALSRFNAKPVRPPDVWFATAANQGLGVELEAAAASRALRELRAMPPPWYLAINASPTFIESGVLADLIAPFPADRIVVEITEHVEVGDYAALTAAMASMRRRGVRLAVDDAGAGFASLRHVVRLQPEIIKMDGSITRDCDRDTHSHALAATLAEFAIRLGASLVVEAVETPDELATLSSLGAPLAQGYLFAAPGRLEDLRTSYPIDIPNGYPLAAR